MRKNYIAYLSSISQIEDGILAVEVVTMIRLKEHDVFYSTLLSMLTVIIINVKEKYEKVL